VGSSHPVCQRKVNLSLTNFLFLSDSKNKKKMKIKLNWDMVGLYC